MISVGERPVGTAVGIAVAPAMRWCTVAAEEVIEHMETRAATKKTGHARTMTSAAEWEERHSKQNVDGSCKGIQPFEKKQFCIRMETTFGRSKEEAEELWNEALNGPWKRDNLGYKGVQRLWLPKRISAHGAAARARCRSVGGIEQGEEARRPRRVHAQATRS